MSPSLRTFSTMKIGGSAEKIVRLSDLSDLSQPLPTPIRILGNGSNVLIDDRGLKGTVVVVRDFPPEEPQILEDTKNFVRLKASAGMFLPTLARWTARRGYAGCEYMVGVPGTVGGAVVQNAGANEQDVSQILTNVEVFDLSNQTKKTLTAQECGLSYRHSRLKEMLDLLVVSAEFKLLKEEAAVIEERVERNLSYRKQKTPYTKPSLGSVFTRLKDGENWIYPGKLIEDAGLKGFQIGRAQVSPVHANYIVHDGDARFEEVLKLIEYIEKKVFEHSGVKLQREILIWSDLAG